MPRQIHQKEECVEYKRLGQTELEVSVLGFGTAPLGGLFGSVSEAEALRLVDSVLDQGINFIDSSPFYGNSEYRLGKALKGRRDSVIVGTKAGRTMDGGFDFTPAGIRMSVENSLRLLGTDHVDLLQLHDIEFGPVDEILTQGYGELLKLRDEGKCRYIGMTGYPLTVMRRALTETNLDVLLTYAHGTLLDNSICHELMETAAENAVGLINAAAVALGLLTSNVLSVQSGHPAPLAVRDAAVKMVSLCKKEGIDPAFVATQFSIQKSGCATTLIGTGKASHLAAAVAAAATPIDESLLARLLALRPAPEEQQWDLQPAAE